MRSRLIALIIMSVLLLALASSLEVEGVSSSSLKEGPYIDKIVYKVIANQDQRILALQRGDIDMDNSFFDPVHFMELQEDEYIDINSALRNGYGHYTINCREYPLNISGLRRAIAYALDKYEMTSMIMDGFSREHDSVVPYVSDFCIEDDFEWHYYDARPDIGNAILDNLNFTIDPGTGFRRAPDGSPFDIVFEYASSSCELSGGSAQFGVDACRELHIDAKARASEFNEYISRLDNHGDYDVVFYGLNFYSTKVDWLAYEYWSEYADVPYENPTNFVNTTYDSWRDQLLHGTTYEEVYEAAAEMQKILHYNVPRIVIYQNIYMQGYRNDKFTGHVPDMTAYITGPWTMRKVHRIEGGYGGTLNVATSQEPNSFNIFTTNSPYSRNILDMLYSSLYDRDPEGYPIGDLAKSLITEKHVDNEAVPEGHTRFTIGIIHNATWTDGMPLTAEDVSFTFNYIMMANITNIFDSGSLFGIWSPTPYRVVFEFSTESYWHFSKFAYQWIIPKHIFNDAYGIGYEGWETWNPSFNPTHPHVTSGPFNLTDFDPGEYYELSYNPNFYYAPDRSLPITTNQTISTTQTSTSTPTSESFNPIPLATGVVVGFSTLVIIVMFGEICRKERVG
ncbi:MAG: ABC transporter substrate-binding protein [Candidatus Thorarchaeota archaeon]